MNIPRKKLVGCCNRHADNMACDCPRPAKPHRKAAPKARDVMTRLITAATARKRAGKVQVRFDGDVWQFLTAIQDIPIKVRLAQSANDLGWT
jgi:hypothetical protein